MRAPLFPRGFILCDRPLHAIPEGFAEAGFSGGYLYTHKWCDIAIQQASGVQIAVLGTVFCSISGEHRNEKIARDCCRHLRESQDSFLEYASHLVGRFVILFESGGPINLVNDAAGMRSVYVHAGDSGAFVGSHPHLIADAAGIDAAEAFPYRTRLGYPGFTSPIAGVSLHNPSTMLRFPELTIERLKNPFAPSQIAPKDAASVIAERARTVAKSLSGLDNVCVSLTAGTDSRLTLAFTLPYKEKFTYFTYDGERDSTKLDVVEAEKLARKYDLPHVRLRTVDIKVPPDMGAALKRNSIQPHGFKVAAAYVDQFGANDMLHVRSNICELLHVSDVDKFEKRSAISLDSPENMGACYFRSARATGEYCTDIDRHFREFLDHGQDDEEIIGSDRYFIEHRMASWHSNLVNESDIAFETIVIFNSREIRDLACQVPKAARLRRELVDWIMEFSGTDVADHPFNGTTPETHIAPDMAKAEV